MPACARVPSLQPSKSPEWAHQHERERAVIDRISAQDIAPKVAAAQYGVPYFTLKEVGNHLRCTGSSAADQRVPKAAVSAWAGAVGH